MRLVEAGRNLYSKREKALIAASRTLRVRAELARVRFAGEQTAAVVGVLALGEAEDVHVGAVLIEGTPSRAEREALAEETNGSIVAAGAALRGERDLMRPVAVEQSEPVQASLVSSKKPQP